MFNTVMESSVDEDILSFVELPPIKVEVYDKLDNVPVNSIFCHSPNPKEPFVVNRTASNVICASNNDETTSDSVVEFSQRDNNITRTSISKCQRVKKLKKNLKPNKSKKGSKASFSKKIKSKLKNVKKSTNSSKSDADAKKPKCEYPRLCSGCGHAYKTKQSFWNHKQRCPMLPENMRSAKVDANGVPIAETVDSKFERRKEYICAHCERHYRKKYNLREHLKNTCRGKPCSKGRLQCWETGCMQAFYKYVDLVQHVTLKHGQDLKIQKLQFPNFSAFNTWKTEESNSKFMYARKITGSKRFSNTKYHYFVCQFNHRNEKKNSNRKTNRRKKDSLVVPNYNCPSRIMVKESENQILVTYISSHNHELNLSNVKYQPLEKETRAYIKTLLQLGVTPTKIIDHLRAGVGNPEIDSFLTTKQHFLTLNRIKRMESKLRAKNRSDNSQRETEENKPTVSAACDSDSFIPEDSFPMCNVAELSDDVDNTVASSTPSLLPCASIEKTPPLPKPSAHSKESDEMIRSIESNLKKLKGYVHKNNIKEKLSSRISQLIQELCDECESMEGSSSQSNRSTPARKPRVQNANRKRKVPAAAKAPNVTTNLVTTAPSSLISVAPSQTVSIAVPTVAVAAAVTTALPMQQHSAHMMQPIIIQQPLQTHQIHHLAVPQSIESMGEVRIVNAVVNQILAHEAPVQHEKGFTPVINETTDLLKPVFQPFNINLLSMKTIDRCISEHEQLLLQQVDDQFSVGCLHNAVVNGFLNVICRSLSNVLAADTSITEFVHVHQKVPDVWHCFNWADIDTIFIPFNPSKTQWILMVVLIKQLEVQILDPNSSYEDAILNIYKKHETTIQCWYEVLRNFLGIAQWNVTSPQHTKHPDPANSGILICWYVLQYINKRSLMDNVDLDYTFRQFIYDTIVNNCSPI